MERGVVKICPALSPPKLRAWCFDTYIVIVRFSNRFEGSFQYHPSLWDGKGVLEVGSFSCGGTGAGTAKC